MRSRQRGATLIGIVVILAILGFALYAAIRLVPVYFEYMAVVRALEQTAKELGGGPTSPQELRNALDRRWIVEDINSIKTKEVEIKKAGSGFSMRAWYRAEAPFVSNVSLVADFDKTVLVGGDSGGGG
jgi:DNA-binding NtrC family response regulator